MNKLACFAPCWRVGLKIRDFQHFLAFFGVFWDKKAEKAKMPKFGGVIPRQFRGIPRHGPRHEEKEGVWGCFWGENEAKTGSKSTCLGAEFRGNSAALLGEAEKLRIRLFAEIAMKSSQNVSIQLNLGLCTQKKEKMDRNRPNEEQNVPKLENWGKWVKKKWKSPKCQEPRQAVMEDEFAVPEVKPRAKGFQKESLRVSASS